MGLLGALRRLLERLLGSWGAFKHLVVPWGAFGGAFGYHLGRLGMPWGAPWGALGVPWTAFFDFGGKGNLVSEDV